MRLYEYEAKRIFRRVAIPVLEGTLITLENLEDLALVVYPVVIKAQSFLGGRGKAGLIQTAHDRDEAVQVVRNMIGRKHGPFVIERVLVEKKVSIIRECYLAASIDRLAHRLMIIASTEGGMDIEQTALSAPDKILKYYFNVSKKLNEFKARSIASDIGFKGLLLNQAAAVIDHLYTLFCDLDCKLVEINPLAQAEDGHIFALDAKVDLDEDAMFRHPELKEMGIEVRHEIGELTDREKRAKAQGIPYVDLDGDIGVFPGGAGFGIAAIDLITHFGGNPANFMDSGGAPTQEKLRAMLGLLIDNPRVKVIFGARFGGISRCDDWAKALVHYVRENKPRKPMIMRMAGNMEAEGRKIIEAAKKEDPELFQTIKIYAVDTPIEDVIKETIRSARAPGPD